MEVIADFREIIRLPVNPARILRTKEAWCLQPLIGSRWNVLHDILNLATEDHAKIVDGCGVDGFVFAELVQG